MRSLKFAVAVDVEAGADADVADEVVHEVEAVLIFKDLLLNLWLLLRMEIHIRMDAKMDHAMSVEVITIFEITEAYVNCTNETRNRFRN
jgi:hypothetical protein